MTIKNCVVIDSIYGPLLVNRHCHMQAEALIKTGKSHIESELQGMYKVVDRLPANCVIVDGGANIGLVSIPLAQRIAPKNGTVISFEPQTEMFNCLAGSVALTGSHNVKLVRAGLGTVSGTASLPAIDYGQEQDFGVVSLRDVKDGFLVSDVLGLGNTVAVVALDDLALPTLDFFKLDVEGWEIHALKGARATIHKHRPFLWIEYWLIGIEAITTELNDLPGYKWEIQDDLNVLFCPLEKI